MAKEKAIRKTRPQRRQPAERPNLPEATEDADQIDRLKSVEIRVGLSPSTIYRLMKLRRFPKPIWLSANCCGWRRSEITTWIKSRTSDREAELGRLFDPRESEALKREREGASK